MIIGPPTAPLTRSLALDLERRGFMVYVVVHAVEDEQIIHNESRIDIRPLLLDVGNVCLLSCFLSQEAISSSQAY